VGEGAVLGESEVPGDCPPASLSTTAAMRAAQAAAACRRAAGAAARQSALHTPPPPPPLFDHPTHVPLTPIQRALVALTSGIGALADPRRADLVAAAADAGGGGAWAAAAARLAAAPGVQVVLAERRRVTRETLAAAAACGEGSFGAAYASFMASRRFDPLSRPPVRYVDGAGAAYAALRARECHDYWHALFNVPTSLLGEVALKAVECVQLGLPAAGLGAVGAAFRLSRADRARLPSVLPWAARAGGRAADLVCLDYEAAFGEDLGAVRERWRVSPALAEWWEVAQGEP